MKNVAISVFLLLLSVQTIQGMSANSSLDLVLIQGIIILDYYQ